MKKVLIIGLVLLVGCAQTVKTDVGKSELSQEQELIKSYITLCFSVAKDMDQGDIHLIKACDKFSELKTPEEKNRAFNHLAQAKQYYNLAEETINKMSLLQDRKQTEEIYSLILQSVEKQIDSVSIIEDRLNLVADNFSPSHQILVGTYMHLLDKLGDALWRFDKALAKIIKIIDVTEKEKPPPDLRKDIEKFKRQPEPLKRSRLKNSFGKIARDFDIDPVFGDGLYEFE